MKKPIYIYVLLLLSSCSVKQATDQEALVEIRYNPVEIFDDIFPKEAIDTLILVNFQMGFNDDSLKVWGDSHLLFSGQAYTNDECRFSHTVIIEKNKKFDNCLIKINQTYFPSIKLDKRYNHINIDYDRKLNKMMVEYTNVRPMGQRFPCH
jgi:hypothetical protein